jgi:hypothetical protein
MCNKGACINLFQTKRVRSSPNKGMTNNHVLTSAPKNCKTWNIREGWVENCKNPYQQVRYVAAPFVQDRLDSSVPVIQEHYIVHHAMCYTFIMSYQVAVLMKSICAPKKDN